MAWKQAVATSAAVEQFRIVRSLSSTGDQASVAENQIVGELRGVDLNFGAIGASEAEVSRFVAEAYARDAHKALNELRMLKANPERAKTLQFEFLRGVERSEKNLTNFVANVNVVNEMVARNYIGAARAQGARVSASSLRQQGVAVGSARKVQATRKSPAKKVAPKSAKRSTSARRR
ncbi:MAG TPA: hypothetical protein DEB13_03665 [Candidatus Yanofskybacteria bacterium]|nr:hypothetical protein [Candidatus Yanofskybacteria bacterium]